MKVMALFSQEFSDEGEVVPHPCYVQGRPFKHLAEGGLSDAHVSL